MALFSSTTGEFPHSKTAWAIDAGAFQRPCSTAAQPSPASCRTPHADSRREGHPGVRRDHRDLAEILDGVRQAAVEARSSCGSQLRLRDRHRRRPRLPAVGGPGDSTSCRCRTTAGDRWTRSDGRSLRSLRYMRSRAGRTRRRGPRIPLANEREAMVEKRSSAIARVEEAFARSAVVVLAAGHHVLPIDRRDHDRGFVDGQSAFGGTDVEPPALSPQPDRSCGTNGAGSDCSGDRHAPRH
jgi:hypothetical protein